MEHTVGLLCAAWKLLGEWVSGAAERLVSTHSEVQQAQQALSRHLATLLPHTRGSQQQPQLPQQEWAQQQAGSDASSRERECGDQEGRGPQELSRAGSQQREGQGEGGLVERRLHPAEADRLYRALGAQQQQLQEALGDWKAVASCLQVRGGCSWGPRRPGLGRAGQGRAGQGRGARNEAGSLWWKLHWGYSAGIALAAGCLVWPWDILVRNNCARMSSLLRSAAQVHLLEH